jgi:hypothetical protein
VEEQEVGKRAANINAEFEGHALLFLQDFLIRTALAGGLVGVNVPI